jgi:hypothetical protein
MGDAGCGVEPESAHARREEVGEGRVADLGEIGEGEAAGMRPPERLAVAAGR